LTDEASGKMANNSLDFLLKKRKK